MISFRIIALSEARNKSERFQQIKKFVLYFVRSKLAKVSQTFHSRVESFEQSKGGLTANKEKTFIYFKYNKLVWIKRAIDFLK